MAGIEGIDGPRELCDFCGFDSDLYSRADTISSQRTIAAVLSSALGGLDTEVLSKRPDPDTWSIGEYVDHVREVAFAVRFVIESALAEPGVDLGEPPDMGLTGEARVVDIPDALHRVEQEYETIRELLESLDDEQWRQFAIIGGEERSVGSYARHVLHDGLHHMADIGRIRHRFGLGAPKGEGTISALHVSQGGVPKLPVESAMISPSGMDGDSQHNRVHHGRPLQALCLWSADVIAQLQAEGHPITAGAAGENLTVTGVEWAEIRPGAMLTVGKIPMLITAYAIPCAKNAQWFSDRDFNRIHHESNPGSSRLYAIPLGSGEIRPGAVVKVEP
jgi:MOSC domain-containing protein YiiM